MCISMPKPAAQSVPTPTMTSAQDIQLGTADIQKRSAGLYGRLILSGGSKSRPSMAAKSQPEPIGGATPNAPSGTLGLPPNYLGVGVFGGIPTQQA